VENGNADHQRCGEVTAAGVSERKTLRYRSRSCLVDGNDPYATGA
jgi:hypothetical protein